MKIAIVSGSPRKLSLTTRAAKYLNTELEKRGHEIEFIDMRDHVLPFIQEVWTKEELAPADFRPLWRSLHYSDAIVVVTPEYNGGYSPAMKNFFDHFPKDTFSKKAMGIVTASTGAMGGMRAAQQLQQMILGFSGIPSPTMMIVPLIDKKFDAEGNLIDESFNNLAERFISDFVWLGEVLLKGRS